MTLADNLSKTRLEGWPKTPQNDRSESAREQEVMTLMGKYAAMHELNRHVHHIAEAMQVASNTLENIIKAHDSLDTTNGQPPHRSDDISNSLRFQTVYTDNLRCRADAFVDRMKNETRFVRSHLSLHVHLCYGGRLCEKGFVHELTEDHHLCGV